MDCGGNPFHSHYGLRQYFEGSSCTCNVRTYLQILQQAEAAVVTSGTATLEAALLQCPQVVCYGGNPLSVAIARSIIRVKHISLPNLILEKNSVRELIQKDCNPERLREELRLLLKGRQKRRSVLADYKRLQRILGTDGVSGRVAQHMYQMLTGGPQVPRYKVYTQTPLGNFSFSANEFEELTASAFEDDYNLKGFYKSGEPMDEEEARPPVLLMAIEQLDGYFKGTRRSFDLPLHIEGTDFQKHVWSALQRIPYGTTITYAELADMIDNPKATRAVGTGELCESVCRGYSLSPGDRVRRIPGGLCCRTGTETKASGHGKILCA